MRLGAGSEKQRAAARPPVAARVRREHAMRAVRRATLRGRWRVPCAACATRCARPRHAHPCRRWAPRRQHARHPPGHSRVQQAPPVRTRGRSFDRAHDGSASAMRQTRTCWLADWLTGWLADSGPDEIGGPAISLLCHETHHAPCYPPSTHPRLGRPPALGRLSAQALQPQLPLTHPEGRLPTRGVHSRGSRPADGRMGGRADG